MMLAISHLESIIAALRPETRLKVEEEITIAMRDTQKEYNEQPIDKKDVELQHDIWAFHNFLEVSKRITGEYNEVKG